MIFGDIPEEVKIEHSLSNKLSRMLLSLPLWIGYLETDIQDNKVNSYFRLNYTRWRIKL